MKANEFFKAMGIKSVKQFLENDNIRTKEMHDDLKRLVESHKLVGDYYGLTRAKEHAESNYTAPELKNALKQAIADVESCMEVSSESY